MPICQATTLEVAIWVAKFVEDLIKGRTIDKVEVGEKKKGEGFSKFDKKSRLSNSNPKNWKFADKNEAKWCEKCKVKHVGKYIEDVTYYRCGKTGHYARKCTTNYKLCF